jgi:hypothetical protein
MSGVTTLSASSFDDVGVVGVQFLLDGATLGAEVTTSPYSIVWNTTTVPDGPHVLTARARDAAGNTQTAAPITVYVQNGVTPTSGLIAAYGFNESGGTTAADASPTGNTATLVGATWATGRYGAALSISGSGFAEAPDKDVLTLGTNATLAAWVYLNGAPTELASIVNKWSQTLEDEYLFGLTAGRNLFFAWHTSGGNIYGTPAFNDATASAQVPVNVWTHVAVVRSGSDVRFYLNGVLSSTVSGMDAQPFRNGTNTIRIGGQTRGGMSRPFPGRIDEVRIYSRTLVPSELQAIMSTPTEAPGDTTAPAVTIASPAEGSTVAGTATISATASDNVGVAGVQFKLDGANLGAEDTTSPYSISWNTTVVPNGPHTLTAVARDAAGNTTTSAARSVLVSNASPTSGVVASYAFNEGSGSTAADASPTGNPASLRGSATWGAGRYGSALAVYGSGYADADDQTALTPGVSATFEAWVLLSGSPTEQVSIINKWGRSADSEYFLGLDANRRLQFGWRTSGTGAWGTPSFSQTSGTGQVPLNTWTHVAVVRSGATLSFYVNGVLDRTVTAMDANAFRNAGSSLRIGGQNRGGQKRYFPGRIDNARVYNRALTAAGIQQAMQTPGP